MKRDFDAETATLDRLHDHEIDVSEKEMRRRLEAAEFKLADQMALAKSRAEGTEDGAAVARITRSLRSKEKDDDRNPRRTPFRKGGPASATSLLLDQGLSEAEMLDDFVDIATEHNKLAQSAAA